jgi:hypothetical protein
MDGGLRRAARKKLAALTFCEYLGHQGEPMAGETKVAWIGAIAAVGCALISGYFGLKASDASNQASTVSSKQAAAAVGEGYDTTVRPFFDELKGRMDALQGEITLLQAALAEKERGLPAPARPPTTPAPAASKKLEVPPSIRFKSQSFTQFQQPAAQ